MSGHAGRAPRSVVAESGAVEELVAELSGLGSQRAMALRNREVSVPRMPLLNHGVDH